MSSHLLPEEKYQHISNWLYDQAKFKNSCHARSIKTFIGFIPGTDEHYYATDEQIKEAVKNTVRNLYNLNRLALVTRYSDTYDRNDNKFFEPIVSSISNETEVIELLQSLHYQCGEYLTCDTNLYKELKIFIGELCINIFNRNVREKAIN